MFFIGIIIFFLGTSLFSYFVGVPFAAFLNPAMITIILLSIIGVLVATSSYKLFIKGLNAVLSKHYTLDNKERDQAVALFRLLSKTTIFASLIGTFLRCVAVLTSLDDVQLLGHAMGANFITLAGGFIVSIAFFEPAIYILKKTKQQSTLIQEYPKHLGDKLLELCSQNGLSPEDILNATSIQLKKE